LVVAPRAGFEPATNRLTAGHEHLVEPLATIQAMGRCSNTANLSDASVRSYAKLSPLRNSKNGGRGLCKNLCRLTAELAVYLHLGPYSRYIIASIERRLAALDAERVPAVAAE
jgi:hypothetical protein